ncbi:MaoC family dehydratase [Chloroflexota bacterium]
MYYEDFNIGDTYTTPGKTVTEAMITLMVGLGGFVFPLFNDEEYAHNTPFGGCIAPGPMTLFLMGGLEEQSMIYGDDAIAILGIDNVRFKAPLRACDTIRVKVEILAKRETSRPNAGIVTHKSNCMNQNGEVIVESESTVLVKKKQ